MASWQRRVAPPAIAALVVAGFIAGPLTAASAAPDLPAKTATQLLTLAQQAKPQALSGTVEQVSNLGLPDLSGLVPGSGTSASSSQSSTASTALALLTDDQKYRVALAPGKVRVQRYLPTGEQDAVLNGNSLWLWDSAGKGSATHIVGPALPKVSSAQAARAAKIKRDLQTLREDLTPAATPQQVAAEIVSAVRKDGTSTLSVGKAVYVAGRAAYTLDLSPRQSQALVGTVSVALDAKTGQALQLQVRTRAGDKVAYSIGYAQLTYGQPAASNFAFAPPPGAKVTTTDLSKKAQQVARELRQQDPAKVLSSLRETLGAAASTAAGAQDRGASSGFKTYGSGFATVVRVPAAQAKAFDTAAVKRLTQVQPNGDRAVQTTLLTVLIKANGDVLVGSVPLSVLAKY